MGELATSAMIGLLVSLVGFALLLRSTRSRERARNRLAPGAVESEPGAAIGPLIEVFSGILPGRAASRLTLARELREAGFYRPNVLQTYLSLRAVMVVAPIIIGLAAALVLPDEWVRQAIGAGIAAALLGFSLPRAYLRSKGRRRLVEIERALPISVDLLTLGLVAGQGLSAAIARTARELSRPYPALAQELKLTVQLADFHGLDHALGLLAGRVPGTRSAT